MTRISDADVDSLTKVETEFDSIVTLMLDSLSEVETEFDSDCDVDVDSLSEVETEFDSDQMLKLRHSLKLKLYLDSIVTLIDSLF